jgi:integrase
MQPLDPQTYQKLIRGLQKSSNPWAPIIELLARTGMRSHELLSHRPEHIDLQSGMIFIRAAKGSRDRWVPAPRRYLRALIEKRLPEMKPESLKAELRRQWAKLRLEILGIGYDKVSLHSLRASFAVAIYKNSKDILLTQELLGHKAISSTMHYAKIVQSHERRGDILKALNGRRVA